MCARRDCRLDISPLKERARAAYGVDKWGFGFVTLRYIMHLRWVPMDNNDIRTRDGARVPQNLGGEPLPT